MKTAAKRTMVGKKGDRRTVVLVQRATGRPHYLRLSPLQARVLAGALIETARRGPVFVHSFPASYAKGAGRLYLRNTLSVARRAS